MKIQLSSVESAPRSLPIWETILEDLGHPPPRRIARALGVSQTTVYRWNAAGNAPRMAQLSLFWLTSWGRASVHAQAVNDARMACGYVECLRADVRRLEDQVQHLLALGHGSANDALGFGGSRPRVGR
jgi:hypothetical protein